MEPRRLSASTMVALVLAAGAARAQTAQQPIDAARARMETATRAAQECARRQCTSAELEAVMAAMDAARRELDALSPAAAPPAEAPAASSPPQAAPPPPVDWPAPPPYRPGAPPLPPPDMTDGKLWMRREHLGIHWAGIGLASGGALGTFVSVVTFANDVDRAKDFGDIGPQIILGIVGLTVTITGIAFLASGENPMVPEQELPTQRSRPPRDLALHF